MPIPYLVSQQDEVHGRLTPSQKYRAVVLSPWGVEDPRRELHIFETSVAAHRWSNRNGGVVIKIPIELEDWAVADPQGTLFEYLRRRHG